MSTYLVPSVPDSPAGRASRKQSPSPWRYIRTMSSFGFGTSGSKADAGPSGLRARGFIGAVFLAISVRSRVVRTRVRQRERLQPSQLQFRVVREPEAGDRRGALLRELFAQKR